MTGSDDSAEALTELHASLDRRPRPESVVELILRADPAPGGRPLSPDERDLLERAAGRSNPWRVHTTSMSEDFARPVGGARQLAATARLFGAPDGPGAAVRPDRPGDLEAFAAEVGRRIGWEPGGTDFLDDRLDRHERRAAGIELSKRQYNRRFRALRRLAAKADVLRSEQDKRRLLLCGRSGFASEIPRERFLADPDAAYFVAYYAARRKTRREFSLEGRHNPFDEVAAALLARCGDDADWWMVSRVHTAPEVMARLTDAERGELLGRWSAVMRECAQWLGELWRDGDVDREEMVVHRGDDSSTWNTLAQAYNTARSSWLSCLASMGALELLDVACPGKVMRLMAYDLVRWHRSVGGGVDPDTLVWARLPLPWDVLDGRVRCTRQTVEMTCLRAGVNAGQRGWTAPRPRGRVAEFRPTPELVHGVAVADPAWASLLRRAGAFSGKRVRPGYEGVTVRAFAAGAVTGDLPDAR